MRPVRPSGDRLRAARRVGRWLDAGCAVGVGAVERLVDEQRLGQAIEAVAVVREQRDDVVVRTGDEAVYLLLDLVLHLGRERRLHRGGPRAALRELERQRTEPVAHAPARDHRVRDLGELHEIGFRAGRDVVHHEFLRDAPAEQHAELGVELGALDAEAVGIR